MAVNSERNIAREVEAAKSLIGNLAEQGFADDTDLIADTIEGETSLNEAMEIGLSEMDECDIIEVGLIAKIAEFEARLKATKDRKGRIRAAMEQAMVITDQMSLRLTTATLSLSRRAPGVVITNEADIPSNFWIEQERPAPKLDKKALAAALKDGAVAGASLDNGSINLTVRRK